MHGQFSSDAYWGHRFPNGMVDSQRPAKAGEVPLLSGTQNCRLKDNSIDQTGRDLENAIVSRGLFLW